MDPNMAYWLGRKYDVLQQGATADTMRARTADTQVANANAIANRTLAQERETAMRNAELKKKEIEANLLAETLKADAQAAQAAAAVDAQKQRERELQQQRRQSTATPTTYSVSPDPTSTGRSMLTPSTATTTGSQQSNLLQTVPSMLGQGMTAATSSAPYGMVGATAASPPTRLASSSLQGVGLSPQPSALPALGMPTAKLPAISSSTPSSLASTTTPTRRKKPGDN